MDIDLCLQGHFVAGDALAVDTGGSGGMLFHEAGASCTVVTVVVIDGVVTLRVVGVRSSLGTERLVVTALVETVIVTGGAGHCERLSLLCGLEALVPSSPKIAARLVRVCLSGGPCEGSLFSFLFCLGECGRGGYCDLSHLSALS